MKKILFVLLFVLFLFPTFVFAETYTLYDLEDRDFESDILVLHEGDIIDFSNSWSYFHVFLDGVRADNEHIFGFNDLDNMLHSYTIPSDCIFAGMGTLPDRIDNAEYALLLSSNDYDRVIHYTDITEEQVFKTGDMIQFDNDYLYLSAYFYDINQELVEAFMTYNQNYYTYYVFPKVDGKTAYWRVSIFDDGIYRIVPSPHFYQIEFQEPVFSIDCKDSKISYGNKTRCTLSVQYDDDLQFVNFNLNLPNLKISNVTYPEEIEALDGDLEFNLKLLVGYVGNNRKVSLMQFDLEATKNETYLSDIQMIDIYYRGENFENSSGQVNVDLNVVPVNNPKTVKNLVSILLPILLLIGLYLFMNTFNTKKKES